MLMDIAGKVINPKAEPDTLEALRRGYDVAAMVTCPTLNQRCFRCGEHFGYVCVCTREELQAHNAIYGPGFWPTRVTKSVTKTVTKPVTRDAPRTAAERAKAYRERRRASNP